jgi:metallo-beta-lactamase class B
MRTKSAIACALGILAAVILLQAAVSAAPTDSTKTETLSESYRGSQRDNLEYQKIAPFKVFDNLYYVGPGFVSVWLVPTPEGIIMIDSAQEPYVDHVIGSIKKVGFDLKNIKYLILTHGHIDHFGGAARIQELSGARVIALDEDWRMIEAAGAAPGRGNTAPSRVPKRDMVVKEGDTLTLGGETLKFYKHPGHTPGSMSIEFTVFDNGQPHKAFVFGGPGPRGGVAGGEQFLASTKRVAEIPGIEVAVHVHSWLTSYPYPNGGILEREQRLAQRKPGEPNPFVDPASWHLWMQQVQEGAVKNVEDEKRKAAQKTAQ